MNIYSIYKSTCTITNQSYIGFDSNWPSRIESHQKRSKEKNNIKFYNAIRKYGWENFTWELLYQAKETVESKDSHTLTIMEDFFINEYNTKNNGYNTTSGGFGSFQYINELRKQKYKSGESGNTKGLKYYNDGVKSYRLKPNDERCKTLIPDRLIWFHKDSVWWNNGVMEKWCAEQPDETFSRGRLYHPRKVKPSPNDNHLQ